MWACFQMILNIHKNYFKLEGPFKALHNVFFFFFFCMDTGKGNSSLNVAAVYLVSQSVLRKMPKATNFQLLLKATRQLIEQSTVWLTQNLKKRDGVQFSEANLYIVLRAREHFHLVWMIKVVFSEDCACHDWSYRH